VAQNLEGREASVHAEIGQRLDLCSAERLLLDGNDLATSPSRLRKHLGRIVGLTGGDGTRHAGQMVEEMANVIEISP